MRRSHEITRLGQARAVASVWIEHRTWQKVRDDVSSPRADSKSRRRWEGMSGYRQSHSLVDASQGKVGELESVRRRLALRNGWAERERDQHCIRADRHLDVGVPERNLGQDLWNLPTEPLLLRLAATHRRERGLHQDLRRPAEPSTGPSGIGLLERRRIRRGLDRVLCGVQRGPDLVAASSFERVS